MWSIDTRDQDADTIHGTQKPVECMRRPMNTAPGESVFEPFLGSGTTLIAGRICFAVELNPAYVDVAVRRWQAFTGRDARLATADGPSFSAIAAHRASSEPSTERLAPDSEYATGAEA